MNNYIVKIEPMLPETGINGGKFYFTNDNDLNTFLNMYKEYVLNYIATNVFITAPYEYKSDKYNKIVLQYKLKDYHIKGNKLFANRIVGRLRTKKTIIEPEVKIPGTPYKPEKVREEIEKTEWRQLYYYRNIFTKEIRYRLIYEPKVYKEYNMEIVPATYEKEIYTIDSMKYSDIYIDNPIGVLKYIRNNHYKWQTE